MQKDRERWMQLAEMAVNEQDPTKMLEIIDELNELLAKKQDRLEHLPKPDSK